MRGRTTLTQAHVRSKGDGGGVQDIKLIKGIMKNTDAGARTKSPFNVEHVLGQGSRPPQEYHQRALRENKQ